MILCLRLVKFTKMAEEFAGTDTKLESGDNPFVNNGELSQKADYIISHSRITRNEIQIADPDHVGGDDQVDHEETVVPVQGVHLEGDDGCTDASPVKNGIVETDVVAVGQVEVEVGKANATMAEPMRAEEVKLKSKRGCCSVQ